MNSYKRKDEIQKSVEESILEAVTKFKTEDPVFNSYEASREVPEVDGALDADDNQSLWNMANQPPPSEAETKVVPPAGSFTFDPKIFGEGSRSQALEGGPAKPPVFRKNESIPKEDLKDGSQVHRVAMKQAAKTQMSGNVPPPSFEFDSKNLASLNSIQLKLYEGDHLRIAQQRIEDLEKDVDRLRIENERLASASELFQKRAEENFALKQDLEKKMEYSEERFAEERMSLKNNLEMRDSSLKELREKIEDLESRLSNDVRKSRSRERELENRLELARLEKISLVGSKDEIILDLKRQVDQLNHELGNYRKKAAEMNQTIEANQEQFRRTVRALRLALTNLEVNEQIGGRSKKAE